MGQTGHPGDQSRRRRSSALLERDHELRTIDRVLTDARAGVGGIVILEGGFGSGKSHLLGAAAQRALRARMGVFTARARELEREFAFGVAIQLFERPRPQSRALALLVDDAHWADAPSLRLLADLADRIKLLPVAIVLTGRPNAGAADAEALARLRQAPSAQPLRLQPLTREGVARLVRMRFPGAASGFCDACGDITGGNPFLVTEFLDALRREHQAPPRMTPEQLAQLPPTSVVEVVRAALEAMPHPQRALAGALAVLGQAASLTDAAAVALIDQAAARSAADALSADGVLRRGMPMTFVQPLVREAVKSALSPLERAHLHERAAATLRASGAPRKQLVAHLLAAPPPEDEQPRVELALARSDALYEEGRHHAAAEFLRDTLAEPHVQEERARHTLEVAYLAAAAHEPGRHQEAHPRWQRMVSALPERPTPRERRALGHGLIYESVRGAPRAEIRRLADIVWNEGEALASPATARLEWPLLCGALVIADELERAVDLAEAVLAKHPSDPADGIGSGLRACRAWAHFEQGRVADAGAAVATLVEAPAAETRAYTAMALATAARAEIERERPAQAEALLLALAIDPLHESIRTPMFLELRAQLRLAQHRPGEALRDALDAGAAVRSDLGAASPGLFPWRSTAAFAHLALGQPDPARGLAEAEVHEARRHGTTRAVIRALRALGLALGGSAGIATLSEAVAVGAASPARLEHVRALVDLGAALRRANQRTAAREPLRRGLVLSRRGGAEALVSRAATELAAAKARRRVGAPDGGPTLTASERRVAELGAQALSTRQIAEALFIAPKTVEFHFRQIYRKLDISSREQLATALTGRVSQLERAA